MTINIASAALCEFVTILVLFGCSDDRIERQDSDKYIVFEEVNLDMKLLINPHNEKEVFWHYGLDVGGSGRICEPTEGMRCLVLDDFWLFAIPIPVEENPTLGAAWSFEGWRFRVVDNLPVTGTAVEGWDLVIVGAGPNNRDYQFRYNRCDGLLAVIQMAPDFDHGVSNLRDLADWPMKWVMVSPRLFQRVTECWTSTDLPKAKSL